MARQIGKLTAIGVKHIQKKGLHSDGGGLNLRLTSSGGKFWVFRFTQHGKAQEMGLGPLHAVSLADARIKAGDARKLLSEGINPIEARNAARTEAKLSVARAQTFRQCAGVYIESHKAGWRNAMRAWRSALRAECCSMVVRLAEGKISGAYAEYVEKELAGRGLRVINEKLYIATATKTGIEHIFKGTQWDHGGHLEPLRHLGAESIGSPKNFAGVSSNACTFPVDDIIRYAE